MARTSCLAAVLLSANFLEFHAFSASPAAPISGRLRWVRGGVTAVSGSALTLRLRNKLLMISLDAAAPPAVGAIVEAHYTDKRCDRRAVLIFPAGRSAAPSKRPGTSYCGIVKRINRSTSR